MIGGRVDGLWEVSSCTRLSTENAYMCERNGLLPNIVDSLGGDPRRTRQPVVQQGLTSQAMRVLVLMGSSLCPLMGVCPSSLRYCQDRSQITIDVMASFTYDHSDVGLIFGSR